MGLFRCRFCGHKKSRVRKTEFISDYKVISRLRICQSCDNQCRTYEMDVRDVQKVGIQVANELLGKSGEPAERDTVERGDFVPEL